MTPALGEVADVADVVAFAVLIHILELHLFAADGSRDFKGFEDGDAVFPAAAKVVNLPTPGGVAKRLDETSDVMGVDVVPDLLALVAKNLVETPLQVALHQVAEKAVELDPTMVGAGEATAAQAAGLHAKIATVFLNHHIPRDLGGPKDAVLGLIDGEILPNPIEVRGVGIVPARFQFLEREGVGAVTINLVGAHVDKGGLGGKAPGGFQQVESPHRVDIKIIKGPTGREVMAWLSSGVDDHVGLEILKALQDRCAVSNVEFVVGEGLMGIRQPFLVPTRVALRSKKVGTHVVVHAINPPAETGEVADDLRANEAGASGNE